MRNIRGALKNNRKKLLLQTHAGKNTDTQLGPWAYMPAHFYTLLSIGWLSTDSCSVVAWANKTQHCVLIYQWGKTATLATAHTYTKKIITHTSHKVLRNVELINTPIYKDLLFFLLIVHWNKDKALSLRVWLWKHGHTHVLKHSPPRRQVPWKLSLPQTNKKKNVDPYCHPPTEPHRRGEQQHTSFLFVSFVQLFGSVHSSQPCQLKTCVSC